MKFKCLSVLFFSLTVAAVAQVSTIGVVTASASPETRRSRTIAPSSNMTQQKAERMVAQIQRVMPGTMAYAVRPTGSMRPLFDGNCLLLTEKSDFATLEIGDIVVYKHSRTGELVVHRILERRGEGFWTKGDHNDKMDDDIVTPKNYQARIYGIIYTSRSEQNVADSAKKNLRLMASASAR